MARTKTLYRCTECGTTEPKWAGRCTGCEAWGTLLEEVDGPAAGVGVSMLPPSVAPIQISDVDPTEFTPRSTGVAEMDRVLGGGLVPGSVTLLGGEPGIGKSTVLLQAAAEVAASGRKVLYL